MQSHNLLTLDGVSLRPDTVSKSTLADNISYLDFFRNQIGLLYYYQFRRGNISPGQLSLF